MSLCIHDHVVSGSGKWQIAIGCAVCKRGKVELREPARAADHVEGLVFAVL